MLVTIIIPFFNSREFLDRSIRSAISQSYRPIELILVDNNSLDGTLDAIQEYENSYPNLVTVLEEKKKGAPFARTKGLTFARGEWIQFLDSDDEISPEKIEHQLTLTSSEIDVVVGDYKEIKYKRGIRQEKIILSDNDVWKGLIRSKLGITSSNLFRKKALEQVGGWDVTLKSSQEYELMFRMLKSGCKFHIDREIMTTVHLGESSVSQSNDPDRWKEILSTRFQLRDSIREYMIDAGIYTSDRSYCFDKYLYDQLWFNRYKHPNFFTNEIKRRSFRLSRTYQLSRAIKSHGRFCLEMLTAPFRNG